MLQVTRSYLAFCVTDQNNIKEALCSTYYPCGLSYFVYGAKPMKKIN